MAKIMKFENGTFWVNMDDANQSHSPIMKDGKTAIYCLLLYQQIRNDMYTHTFIETSTNATKLVKSYETASEAKKAVKALIKAGRIEKRGYDLFSTSFRNLELRTNY